MAIKLENKFKQEKAPLPGVRFYLIPYMKNGKKLYYYKVLASEDKVDGFEWEHVSVALTDHRGKYLKRLPTWDEMTFIKELFWDDQDCVIQIHPPRSEYVNLNPWVLHLWRGTGEAYKKLMADRPQ